MRLRGDMLPEIERWNGWTNVSVCRLEEESTMVSMKKNWLTGSGGALTGDFFSMGPCNSNLPLTLWQTIDFQDRQNVACRIKVKRFSSLVEDSISCTNFPKTMISLRVTVSMKFFYCEMWLLLSKHNSFLKDRHCVEWGLFIWHNENSWSNEKVMVHFKALCLMHQRFTKIDCWK